MTLTLDIPPNLDAAKRERLAVALYDAQVVSQGRAAQLAGLSRAAFIDALGRYGVTSFQYTVEEILVEAGLASSDILPLQQGSLEWKARLRSNFRAQTSLTDEQTRRESIYGDDLR
ncbi:MAG: UPF0175 family protein [Armatimonadota bacterium]|nr:UPF0175 family protein [Armatimonadota bacterium]